MERPAAYEFDSRQRQRCGLTRTSAGRGSRPSLKRHVPVRLRNQPAIRNRTTGEIPGQILQDVRGSGLRRRWRFDIGHPGDLRQGFPPGLEGRRLPQCRPFAFQLQCPPLPQTPQTTEKRPAKRVPQSVRVDEVASRAMRDVGTPAADPARRTLQRWPATGHQRMHMRVGLQLLIPGVQHHHGRRGKPLLPRDDGTQ